MTCTKCGAQLIPNAQFCGACGTRVVANASDASATPGAATGSGSGGSSYRPAGDTGGFAAPSGGGVGGSGNIGGSGGSNVGGNYGFGGGSAGGGEGASGDSPTPASNMMSGIMGGATGAATNFSNAAGSGAAGGGQAAGHGINIDEDSRGQGRGYSFEILHQPSYALAVLRLQAEQSIQAESGAMVSMSANIELQSQMKGGLMGALKRTIGGESAFVSTFTARGGPGEVTLAPGGPGDIAAIELSEQLFFVQSSSYLAGDAGLTVDTKWGGAKTFFGGEGLFVLQVRGTGLLLLSSFGAIHRKRLAAGERYVVDTGHLVAWEGSTQYTLRKAAQGFFRSMTSGEGVVAEFTGPGELLIQTRNLAAFAGMLKPFFPTQSGGGTGGFNINLGGS